MNLKKLIVVFWCTLFVNHALASSKIGVINYNVKGDIRASRNNGIWSQQQYRTKQISLLNSQISSNQVDFIALQPSFRSSF